MKHKKVALKASVVLWIAASLARPSGLARAEAPPVDLKLFCQSVEAQWTDEWQSMDHSDWNITYFSPESMSTAAGVHPDQVSWVTWILNTIVERAAKDPDLMAKLTKLENFKTHLEPADPHTIEKLNTEIEQRLQDLQSANCGDRSKKWTPGNGCGGFPEFPFQLRTVSFKDFQFEICDAKSNGKTPGPKFCSSLSFSEISSHAQFTTDLARYKELKKASSDAHVKAHPEELRQFLAKKHAGSTVCPPSSGQTSARKKPNDRAVAQNKKKGTHVCTENACTWIAPEDSSSERDSSSSESSSAKP